jgi:rare lipoprotein A
LVLPAVNYSNNRCFVLLNKKNGYNLLFQDTVKKKSQIGMASFYANKFNGRKTASGERFCKDSLTAAHKTLPFGTIIKVTNLATGDTVYARVNDRIPHKKRILDLSPAGAKKLNYYHKGTTKVKVEVIRWP